MLQVTVGIWAVVAYFVLTLSVGWLRATTAAFVFATMLFPERLTHFSEYSYTGMAASAPEITTYALVILLGSVELIVHRKPIIPRAFVPLVAFLLLGFLVLWSASLLHIAGGMQIAIALLASGLGLAYGRGLAENARSQAFLIGVLCVVVVVQLSVAALQMIGVPVFELPPDIARIMEWRVNGTLNHPNNLGKVMFIIIAVALPLTQAPVPRTRKTAYLTVIGAAFTIVLTGGRANLIAVVVTVLLFVVVSRRMQGRFLAPALVFAAAAPFAGEVIARFDEDPQGGSRAHFLEVAFRQLTSTWASGVGPNGYVETVGRFDPLTAGGLPVHNSFMLAAVEMGVLGALLLFAPLLWWAVRAWRLRRRSGGQSHFAAAYLASVGGVALIAVTGWGMLADSILPLWLWSAAVLIGAAGTQSESQVQAAAIDHADAQLSTSARAMQIDKKQP